MGPAAAIVLVAQHEPIPDSNERDACLFLLAKPVFTVTAILPVTTFNDSNPQMGGILRSLMLTTVNEHSSCI